MALTEKQIEARANGIGGSDAPAIAGLSPWKTPLEVWLEKTGQAPHVEENEAMAWGTKLEALIAEEFAARNGQKVQRVNATLIHPQHPWMVGHIDRRIVGNGGILECKATTQRVTEDTGPLEPHVAQVLHYLAVTGGKFGMLAYLVGGRQYLQFRVERDEGAIEALIKIESAFWRHVETRTPPAPVNLQDVARLYPGDNGQAVLAPDGIVASCYRLSALKTQARDVEAQIDAEELAIKGAMGEASTLLGPDGQTLATWKQQKARRFDSTRFKSERPDDYAAYMNETTSRVFRLKTKEEA